MNFKEYQLDATRTCSDLGSLKLNLSHMILGIVSENEEFLKAMVEDDIINAREEQCDQMWYIANYCTYRGFDLTEVVGDINRGLEDFITEDWEGVLPTWDVFSSKLADYVKKFIAYDKELDEELEKKALKAIIWSLTIEDTGLNFEVDLQKNIDKLKVRFPEKFNTVDALNRDLDKERKILES